MSNLKSWVFLVIITFVPPLLACLLSLTGGYPAEFPPSKVWFLKEKEGIVEIQRGSIVPSAEAAFGRENIEPAADVDVTVYFRSDGKLETIDLVTDKDGSYSLRGLDMNQSYVIVFESEGSVLFKTASNPPHHWIKEGDIVLRRNAPGLTVGRNVIESELPERSTPEPFPLRTFLEYYVMCNCLVLLAFWIYLLVAKIAAR